MDPRDKHLPRLQRARSARREPFRSQAARQFARESFALQAPLGRAGQRPPLLPLALCARLAPTRPRPEALFAAGPSAPLANLVRSAVRAQLLPRALGQPAQQAFLALPGRRQPLQPCASPASQAPTRPQEARHLVWGCLAQQVPSAQAARLAPLLPLVWPAPQTATASAALSPVQHALPEPHSSRPRAAAHHRAPSRQALPMCPFTCPAVLLRARLPTRLQKTLAVPCSSPTNSASLLRP